MARSPNILLICTDSLRTDALGFMGNPHAISPHANQLAREGVWFEQAHTVSPVCMPARCSLITGVYPPVHECLENGMGRRQDLETFVEKLNASGYTTIMAGKQHFGACPRFDRIIHPEASELSRLSMDGKFPTDRSFANTSQIIPDAVVVQQTIDAMREHQKRQSPFFAFCSLEAPHVPLIPPSRWMDKMMDFPLPDLNLSPGEESKLPHHQKKLLGLNANEGVENDDLKENPEYWIEAAGRSYDARFATAINAWRRRYYAFAAYADELLGRLLNALDELNLTQDTVVVFTSDHGQQYFDHGFNDKHCWYDESWRIPLIIRHPQVLPAGKREQFANWTDLTATILGIAGIKSENVQGYDLYTPLITGEPNPRSCVAATLFQSCALATREWKIEYYVEEHTGRLFDRVSDPKEQKNQWDSPQHQPIKQHLLLSLLRWQGELISVEKARQNLTAQAPDKGKDTVLVANRVAAAVQNWKGIDPDNHLHAMISTLNLNPIPRN